MWEMRGEGKKSLHATKGNQENTFRGRKHERNE